ncbi:MAG: hypothetical protein U5J98_05970 [Halobacteriales archaeon]|nr:hypothetical protein [Halobacteriales archaeon]
MTDSDQLEALRAKHERNREQRLQAVKSWAQYVKEQPVEVWGPQQNRIVDSQLESARGGDIEQRLRIEDAKPDRRPG